MQNDKTRDSSATLTFFLLSISLIFILIIHIFTHEYSWLVFNFLITFILCIITFSFLLSVFLPLLNFEDKLFVFWKSVSSFIFGNKILLAINNGIIEGDYLLLNNKPKIHLLVVNDKSAAVVLENRSQTNIYQPGFYVFRKPITVLGALSSELKIAKIGPENQATFDPKTHGENLSDYHARISGAEKTRAITRDGVEIFSLIQIFYRIDVNNIETEINKDLLNLFRNSFPISSSPQPGIDLENVLLEKILNDWKRTVEKSTFKEIVTNFPGKYHPQKEILIGLILEVFITGIYQLNKSFAGLIQNEK